MVETKANYFPNPTIVGTHEQQNQQESCNNKLGEQLSLLCADCDLTFIDSVEYEHHNVELHGKNKKLILCKFCNATFRRQDHLKRHIKSLHNNRSYCVCPVCRKDCKRQNLLLQHIKKIHSTAQEVFHCRECTFECGTLSDLDQHEFTHLDRNRCPHCKTTFKRRDHMLRHIKSQHMKQLVVCPECGNSYKRKDHLVRHVREKQDGFA